MGISDVRRTPLQKTTSQDQTKRQKRFQAVESVRVE